MRRAAELGSLGTMSDRKLEALRSCPWVGPLPERSLLVLGRLVELVDVVPGEVLLPADLPPQWGFCCLTGRLHVLAGGCVEPSAAAPVLALAPALGRVPRHRRPAVAMSR